VEGGGGMVEVGGSDLLVVEVSLKLAMIMSELLVPALPEPLSFPFPDPVLNRETLLDMLTTLMLERPERWLPRLSMVPMVSVDELRSPVVDIPLKDSISSLICMDWAAMD